MMAIHVPKLEQMDSNMPILNSATQPSWVDTVKVCGELGEMDMARVRLESPVVIFIHPVHWNNVAPGVLRDKDFYGRLILHPYIPSMAKHRIWVPTGALHGFFNLEDSICVAQVSKDSTLVYPLDTDIPCTIPYVWYKHDPEHVLFCYNLRHGFDRIHESVHVSVVDCHIGPHEYEHLMTMRGDVVMVHNTFDPGCEPGVCHARTLTVDEETLPLLAEVWSSLFVVIVSPEFDATLLDSIVISPSTHVHVVRIGYVIPAM